MVDTLTNLQAVYAKWEGNNPYTQDPSHSSHGNRAPPLRPNQMSSSDYGKMLSSGRDAWRNQYKQGGGPAFQHSRTRDRTRRRTGTPCLSLAEVMKNNVASFKVTPSVYPCANHRPFTARCCTCMPTSRNAYYHDDLRDRGLENILHLNTSSRENGLLTRTFCVLSHVMRTPVISKYPDVTEDVLTNQRVKDAISKTVSEEIASVDQNSGKLLASLRRYQKKVEGRARRVITRMKAALSSTLIRFTAWFLHKLLSRLLSAILIHKGQMHMVKEACKGDLPVLFLPTHRSHLDYILITFILFNHGIMAPHVAAGDNLLIPFFGSLMRGLGGYFIRRKLDKEGKKDYVYRAVLHTYMSELLQRNQYMEFFVEGGRTRSGKAIYPKGGLLSVIVDAYHEGVIGDAYIIPISISYDKILDGNFSQELMGEPKQRETFWRAVSAIWTVVMSHYGNVRVDFSQPFSLKEFVQVAQTFRKPSVNGLLPGTLPTLESPTAESGAMRLNSSDGSIYGTEIVVEDQRQLIQGLAEHIVYASISTQTVMSTHLAAFLMLTKYRQGVDLPTLIKDFDWLKQEITSRGRDLGFSGKSCDVVAHALSLLGKQLVQQEERAITEGNQNEDEKMTVFVRPSVHLPEVFELSYYANITNSVFILESSLANALYSLVDKDQWTNPHGNKILVSRQRLLEQAEMICRCLKYEYIFSPSCVSISQSLVEAFDKMTSAEILQSPEEDDPCEDDNTRAYARRLNKSLTFTVEDDSDEESWTSNDLMYEVSHEDSYAMGKLQFLRSILAPVLETYFVTACNLTCLIGKDMPEEDFVVRTHKQLKDRVSSGVADYAESCSLDTLKNSVRSFHHHKVMTCYQAAGLKMVGLETPYRSEVMLHKLIECFEAYRD